MNRRSSRRFSESGLDSLVLTQQQLVEVVGRLDIKLDAICEAVGSQQQHTRTPTRRHSENWTQRPSADGDAAPVQREVSFMPALSAQAAETLSRETTAPRLGYQRAGSCESNSRPSVISGAPELFSQHSTQKSNRLSGSTCHQSQSESLWWSSKASRPSCMSVGQELTEAVGGPTWLRMRPGIGLASTSLPLTPNHFHPRMSGAPAMGATPSSQMSPRTPRTTIAIENDGELERICMRGWDPDSRSRTVFDITSMIMLLYDAFMVPYLLAWRVSSEGLFATTAVWCTRVFWTIDLLLNLVTGYRGPDARLVLDIPRAMQHYMSRWFFPDLILVTLDWLTTYSTTSGQTWLRWMRVMRLVRSGRQVVRAWTLVMKAKLMIQAHSINLLMDLSVFLLAIVWVNHIVCCGWYSLGRLESDTGQTWLSTGGYEQSQYYEYWTALHWAMTQMTPGSMEVVPRSSGERMYNVGTLLLGLLMGSSLVATLTSMLTQYKLRVEGSSRKLMILHQFLTQQGVDQRLALAIKLQVKARSAEKARLKAADVEYLSLLSKSMQDKLWHSWCMQHLSRHQLLNSLELLDPMAVKSICKGALTSMEFAGGDNVFEEGNLGDAMYILVFGQTQYSSDDSPLEAVPSSGSETVVLKPGTWFCEPALWTEWTHLGTMEATSSTEVLAVSGPRLLAVLGRHPAAFDVVREYCLAFHRQINEPGAVRSDLPFAFDICELMSSLSHEARLQLARPCLQLLEARYWEVPFVNKADFHLLKEEISSGKCDVSLVDDEVVRNTSILALRLHKRPSSQDRFLVRIGEITAESGKPVPCCLLPGVKRKWRESNSAAVTRILQDELGEIASDVEIHWDDGGKRTVAMNESPTYGIRTRYMRTSFTATLSSGTKLRYLQVSAEPLEASREACGVFAGLFRPNRRQNALLQTRIIGVLAEHERVVVIDRTKDTCASRSLYLWLNEQEFKVLSSPVAKPLIAKWLSTLDDLDLDVDTASSPVGSLQAAEANIPRGPRLETPVHESKAEHVLSL